MTNVLSEVVMTMTTLRLVTTMMEMAQSDVDEAFIMEEDMVSIVNKDGEFEADMVEQIQVELDKENQLQCREVVMEFVVRTEVGAQHQCVTYSKTRDVNLRVRQSVCFVQYHVMHFQ